MAKLGVQGIGVLHLSRPADVCLGSTCWWASKGKSAHSMYIGLPPCAIFRPPKARLLDADAMGYYLKLSIWRADCDAISWAQLVKPDCSHPLSKKKKPSLKACYFLVQLGC